MRLRFLLIALLGVALAVYLIFNIGFSAVFSAALRIGWGGFVITCLYALALYVFLGSAWYVLVPGLTWRRMWTFVWGRIVRDSAAEVLPFSQVGGFVIGARATILNGVPARLAFASTIVDVTTEMVAQIAYIALGLTILRQRVPMTPLNTSLVNTLLVGLVVGVFVGIAFIVVQNKSTWITDKLADRFLPRAFAHAAAVAEALRAIYRQPMRVVLSIVMHMVGWIGSAMVTFIAALLIGANVDLPGMIALDSLVFAIRTAGFVVPNALGVQEAAYALLGPLLGVPPEMALAVSLLRRARDIAIGIPTLFIWQAWEGKRAFAEPGSDSESLQN
jgi:putative membrane protein